MEVMSATLVEVHAKVERITKEQDFQLIILMSLTSIQKRPESAYKDDLTMTLWLL